MGESALAELRRYIGEGIPAELPPTQEPSAEVDHAPKRRQVLSQSEEVLALQNALRYFPQEWHQVLAEEFLSELRDYGRIYMHRFRPNQYPMRAHSLDSYPCKSKQAAAIMLMIQNNLSAEVAQFPHELITYGGNGSVFQNWAQYRLTMQYLTQMDDEQTLVMYSGHPLGLFPSHSDAPRVVVSNGMMIPNYSSQEDYERFNALGVTQYGQMTAGSYMYIGPQGIVHGTMITLLNAARIHLAREFPGGLAGVTFVTSGLGGMSGAQAKAAVIAGAVCIIAEINPHAANKRHSQGWVDELYEDVDSAIDRLIVARELENGLSIGYVGNVVDLWERLLARDVRIDLGSDQTSLHNPWQGGYFPAGIDFDTSMVMMSEDPDNFRNAVEVSLRRQVEAINSMCGKGMYFWDYGNAFLLEASRAGADVLDEEGNFTYPSYVEDIMGPKCFDYGFGPFRWVCTSGSQKDLAATDGIAAAVIAEMATNSPEDISQQLGDNLKWIENAAQHQLVVGSQARILYADEQGRRKIAQAFNTAIAEDEISAPVVIGRDHHDVSGTDSPFRETANIRDGSAFCADMAIHNVIGDGFRGATWVSIHNGGGVGWGEAINGGFGLLLDGSSDTNRRLHMMLSWDVNNGVARRAWARNDEALSAIERAMANEPSLKVTIPSIADVGELRDLVGLSDN
ncbi:MAG TPA: urocanate hydratase [Candidatus Poseidoniales archaeon]|nr:urocanate hydratase [Candidatus Poseidoniales archaeon]